MKLKKIRLNLGCRNVLLKNFINIDIDDIHFIHSSDKKFKRIDAMNLDLHFEAKSVDEVTASHFFEHLSANEVSALLLKIWGILKPEGTLTIVVPDFCNIINHYRQKHKNKDFKDLDILHSRIFNCFEQSPHKTVWYDEIGKYYLERENLFAVTRISQLNFSEIMFLAKKICNEN